jgi:hypothetical protein
MKYFPVSRGAPASSKVASPLPTTGTRCQDGAGTGGRRRAHHGAGGRSQAQTSTAVPRLRQAQPSRAVPWLRQTQTGRAVPRLAAAYFRSGRPRTFSIWSANQFTDLNCRSTTSINRPQLSEFSWQIPGESPSGASGVRTFSHSQLTDINRQASTGLNCQTSIGRQQLVGSNTQPEARGAFPRTGLSWQVTVDRYQVQAPSVRGWGADIFTPRTPNPRAPWPLPRGPRLTPAEGRQQLVTVASHAVMDGIDPHIHGSTVGLTSGFGERMGCHSCALPAAAISSRPLGIHAAVALPLLSPSLTTDASQRWGQRAVRLAALARYMEWGQELTTQDVDAARC